MNIGVLKQKMVRDKKSRLPGTSPQADTILNEGMLFGLAIANALDRKFPNCKSICFSQDTFGEHLGSVGAEFHNGGYIDVFFTGTQGPRVDAVYYYPTSSMANYIIKEPDDGDGMSPGEFYSLLHNI